MIEIRRLPIILFRPIRELKMKRYSFLFSEPWLVLSLCANNVSLRRAEKRAKIYGYNDKVVRHQCNTISISGLLVEGSPLGPMICVVKMFNMPLLNK